MDFENEFEYDSVEEELGQQRLEEERTEYGSVYEYVRKSEDILAKKLWDTVRYLLIAVAVYFLVRWKFPYLAVDAMLGVALARPFVRYFSRHKIVTTVTNRNGEVEDRFISGSLWFVGAIIGMILSSFFFMGVKPVTSAWFPAYAIAPDVLQWGVVAFIMAVPLVNNIHDIIACRSIGVYGRAKGEDAALAYAEYSFEKRKKTNKKLIVVWIIAMIVVMIGQFAFSLACSVHAAASFDAWNAWLTVKEVDYDLTKEQVENPVKIEKHSYKGTCEVAYSLLHYDGIYHKKVAMINHYRYSPIGGWVEDYTEVKEEIQSMEATGVWTGVLERIGMFSNVAHDATLTIDSMTFEEAKGQIKLVNKQSGETIESAFTATVAKSEDGRLVINAVFESPWGNVLEYFDKMTFYYNMETHEIESPSGYRGTLVRTKK